MNTEIHRPDILTCLANLSSDEVFTPPKVVNKMLDLLPLEVWRNPDLKWLNPASKSGGILREIAQRLMEGLKAWEPDEVKRRSHILQTMVYGIGITEICALLTRRSLYCSIHANSEQSNCKMATEEGNIFFNSTNHTFKNGNCIFCGAPEKEEYVDDVKQEIHAYQFIHDNLFEALKNMKIDIIVMNPPYQLKDGGHGASARPIYHKFVERAKEISEHLVAIIPARWYAGGKGLDDFRAAMLADKSIKTVVDIPSSEDLFPGVAIAGGICYFHRDKNYKGLCKFNGVDRALNDFDVVIRDHRAISILRKIIDKQTLTGGGLVLRDSQPKKTLWPANQLQSLHWFSETVRSLKPFGLRTFFKNFIKEMKTTYPCRTKDGIQYVAQTEITQGHDIVGKWKTICSRADGAASQTDSEGKKRGLSISEVLPPNHICLETYLVTGTYKTGKEAENAAAYLLLKLPRFLLCLRKLDQNISAERFKWVPIVDFTQEWDDTKVYNYFGLTNEEIVTVESTIK